MSANDWQSPLPPPPTSDANAPGFGGGDGGRQDVSLTGWNASGKGYQGIVMPFMEISDRDPIPKWDFQEPGARLRPWLRELSFGRHDTRTPANKQGVKLYKAIAPRNVGRSLADQFSEDQICSGQGFDLIIGAIRHHFRSYLEAEPEVQAEIALYQTTRIPKGTFVEYTSRISNKLRELESGFKELLPTKLKGTVVTRNQTAMCRLIRWKLKLPRQPNRTTTITTKAASDTDSDQLDWDPEKIDDDGYPLVDENGSTPVPIPREGPLDEDEASSLTAWAQLYREVRKKLARFSHGTWLL